MKKQKLFEVEEEIDNHNNIMIYFFLLENT